MGDLPFAEALCMPPVTVDFTFVAKPSLLVKVAPASRSLPASPVVLY